ncbi:MAG: hypothetical protein ABT08_08790 [Microbacterium sp. SCN 71-21]|nr:MAG: hypothetical protein ABT08_08790 [Microbacterium sp. SCN 71-21]
MGRAHRLHEGDAVHPRQTAVDDHRLVPPRQRTLQGALTVGDVVDPVDLREHLDRDLRDLGVVLDVEQRGSLGAVGLGGAHAPSTPCGR